jgi:hypothetical protein
MYNKNQTSRHTLLRGVQERIAWSDANTDSVVDILVAVTSGGGYVGFGQNRDHTALLLYIKTDVLNERIAFEDKETLTDALVRLLAELGPHLT